MMSEMSDSTTVTAVPSSVLPQPRLTNERKLIMPKAIVNLKDSDWGRARQIDLGEVAPETARLLREAAAGQHAGQIFDMHDTAFLGGHVGDVVIEEN